MPENLTLWKSFWKWWDRNVCMLAMPLKFGIVGKLLVRRTRESFPFRERRWHIWITSSSQSASADWLSDSNGRSLWPISAAYGAAATTVSTVSTVIFAFDGRFLWWSVFQAHMQLCNDVEKSEFASWWFRHDLPTLGRFFFLFYLLSFASPAFSMEELESLIVIIIIRVSCANWLDYYMSYMAKTEEFEEKIKRTTSCEEVEKFWHYCWQESIRTYVLLLQQCSSGSVGQVDEQFEDCMLVAGGSPSLVEDRDGVATRTAWPSPYIVMSTRMRPTHNSRGNNAELRVLLLKWCGMKGDLWRVESQFCKPQFKFCSVTFPQICFLCASVSAEWGKLEQIRKQFLRKETHCFHVRGQKSTSEQFLEISLCNKCEEPPSSSAGNGLVWLMCSGKKTILLLWKPTPSMLPRISGCSQRNFHFLLQYHTAE